MNRFLQDIRDQPQALHHVLAHMLGAGRADLVRAAQLIQAAPRVVLTSMGSAYYSLMPMGYALARLHPNVHLIETSELMRLPFFTGTVTVIMSRSGESGEIAQYARLLRERGEALIAITMTPDSSLAHNATLMIHDPSPFDGFICTKAYSTMALVGLLIASEMEQRIDKDLTEGLARTFDWMQSASDSILEQIQQLAWLGASLTFLSRGVGLGLAMVGALWFEESARVRASFSSVDNFLHGPVEQVDEHFHGIWIDLQPDMLSAGQQQKITSKGGEWVRLVLEGAYPGDFTLPDFDLPEAFRILTAMMPVQMIAYQSAANRGLDAGNMRYVTWVVK